MDDSSLFYLNGIPLIRYFYKYTVMKGMPLVTLSVSVKYFICANLKKLTTPVDSTKHFPPHQIRNHFSFREQKKQ